MLKMRIIEPQHIYKNGAPRPTKRKRIKTHVPTFCVVLVAALCYAYIVYAQKVNPNTPAIPLPGALHVNEQENNDERPKILKKFSGTEFKNLYSSFVYPNTQAFIEPPAITGDKPTDNKIRELAEARGYKLSSLPVSNIVKIGEPNLSDDDLIQPFALLAWQEMKAAALAERIPLQITSAYRSPEFQRDLFLNRLWATNVSYASIVAGRADAKVNFVLDRAAIPGYSRHHTGYTIDLACDGVGLDGFKGTACFQWLSKNNYENTKKFGWVPSYPEEASQQGPEPEAWEYIWVGKGALYE